MIVTTAQLFKLAYGKYAVGAYNINNMEQALGLFEGCLQSQAPFIIQLSKGSRKYAGAKMIEAIIRAAEERYPEAVFAVHLDHGDEATCYDCIDSGFYSSVMIDASHEVFDENVAITKRVVERAHAKGLSVEAELGNRAEYDPKMLSENLMFGTPKQIIEKLKKYEALGVDEFTYYASLGLGLKEQKRSLELFCKEVVPAFERADTPAKKRA